MATTLIKMLAVLLLFSSLLAFPIFAAAIDENARSSQTTPSVFLLPVTKDAASLQYLARIHHGTPLAPIDLVLDLSGVLSWFDCSPTSDDDSTPSSSRRRIESRSIQCLAAKGRNNCDNGNCFCALTPQNSVAGTTAQGELAEDVVAVGSGGRSELRFLFSCAPRHLLRGLPSRSRGMLGLGGSRISFPSQIAAETGIIRREFAVCLSPTDGGAVIIAAEDGGRLSVPYSRIWNSLAYTPLAEGNGEDREHSHRVNVTSIRVNGRKLAAALTRGAGISTAVPYTVMESSIYGEFAEMVTASTNLTRAAAAWPFADCYRTEVGGAPVAVELVLQSEMVKWRIDGGSSLVRVNDEVVCLGFLDGGSNLPGGAHMVIGGHQLEDHLLHFDLGASMLGFSSSLSAPPSQSSCADLRSKYKQIHWPSPEVGGL